MRRGDFDPAQFGVDLSRVEFIDQMVNDFNQIYRDDLTFDELLLHPQEAAGFCQEIRRKRGYYDLPDDIILRSIMNARKHG
jgi:hypothetical protein